MMSNVARAPDHERLDALRAGGRRAFVWRQGVLWFGLPWAVLMAGYRYIFTPDWGPFPALLREEELVPVRVA
jgi:hypothetical protein